MCHKHPGLAGLSQTEGVTQKTAVTLTSVGSNQTQPAACQHNQPGPLKPWWNNAGVLLVHFRWVGFETVNLYCILLTYKCAGTSLLNIINVCHLNTGCCSGQLDLQTKSRHKKCNSQFQTNQIQWMQKKLKFTSPTMHQCAVLEGIWWPNLCIIEDAMLDPTGDIPSEHTRAELLRKLPPVCTEISSGITYTHTQPSQHIHTLTLSLLHPSASICSQAVPTFWWISQAYFLAQVDTGADYFSMNPTSLSSSCRMYTPKNQLPSLSCGELIK